MKTVWIAGLVAAVAGSAVAQTTIYKHVDESGRVTYSNKPMKGAVVLDLEPLTTIPGTPGGSLAVQKPSPVAIDKAEVRSDVQPVAMEARIQSKPAVAVVTPVASVATVAAIDPQLQKRRDDGRRKILESELEREEQSLTSVRKTLGEEQQNPALVQAVRVAQQAVDPTASEMAEFRKNIEKASGRIRGLQSTVAEHEKNIEALKKELGALKP